jgi:nucleoside-diphosphate-sugar epimerase
MKPNSRILIAGCGYVGCATAELLRDQGHVVFGIRRDVTKLPQGVAPVALDLLSDNYQSLPTNLDALVWALSPHPDEAGYQAAYVDAPRRLLQFLEQRGDPIARAVLVSSTSVWQLDDGSFVDEQSPASPGSFRGASVLAGEKVFSASPFSSTSLRFAGIYGPGRTYMLDRIANGKAAPPREANYGNRIWRDDGARAIEHVLSLANPDPIYAVVDNDPADLREVYAWIANELKVDLASAIDTFTGRGGNKRIRNQSLRSSGWAPLVPNYRIGYTRLLNER